MTGLYLVVVLARRAIASNVTIILRAFRSFVKLTASPKKLHTTLRPAAGDFENMTGRNGVIELPMCRMMIVERSPHFMQVLDNFHGAIIIKISRLKIMISYRHTMQLIAHIIDMSIIFLAVGRELVILFIDIYKVSSFLRHESNARIIGSKGIEFAV